MPSDPTKPIPTPAMRVLLVEDDPILGRALEVGLTLEGLDVDWKRDGAAAYEAFRLGRFDALLIDLGLPGMDGFDILCRIRQDDAAVPILIVTGRDSINDRIRGLDSGADDYLVKPFELVELLARLRAVKRRSSAHRQSLMIYGEIVIDVARQLVFLRGEPVALSAREFSVLRLLVDSVGPRSLAQIVEHLRGMDVAAEEGDVAMCLEALHRELGPDFSAIRRRVLQRGAGRSH
jgi:DNA-binding response OmpR family regulator